MLLTPVGTPFNINNTNETSSMILYNNMIVHEYSYYDNLLCAIGTYGRIYEGYLANAEDDVEGAVSVMIKTVIG